MADASRTDLTRLTGFPRCAADNGSSSWVLTAEETDTIALGMLLLLGLPIEARVHALAAGLWRRFAGVEGTAVRPSPEEWR
jgi:hypothetical protein